MIKIKLKNSVYYAIVALDIQIFTCQIIETFWIPKILSVDSQGYLCISVYQHLLQFAFRNYEF